jgi:hypothetical protein
MTDLYNISNNDIKCYMIIINYFINNKFENIEMIKIQNNFNNCLLNISKNISKSILFVNYNISHNLSFWIDLLNDKNSEYTDLMILIINNYDIFIKNFIKLIKTKNNQ